ncbi:MAG: hypothetical protein RR205_01035 [Oscillospiraceae bacterium]
MLESILQIRDAFITELEACPSLKNVKFYKAFPLLYMEQPITGVAAAVELMEITAGKSGFGSYAGFGAQGETFASNMKIQLGVSILCDAHTNAEGCWKAFGSICDKLLLEPNSFAATNVSCESIKYDSRSMGMLLKATVTLSPIGISNRTPAGFDKIQLNKQ